MQEAFVAALTHLDSYDPRRRFAPWLFRIVVTRALNVRVARGRRVAAALDDTVPSTAPDPATLAERADLAARVATALRALSERQRAVVQLVELDGFSTADVAEMLGMSPATARWHLHVARQALRRLLAAERAEA